MAVELSYLIITPYTLRKSRTGGVIARLLSRSDLDLVGARILTPSQELADSYAALIRKTVGQRDEKAAKMLSDYVKENFSPLPNGKKERIMLLLFRGEDACKKLFTIAGPIIHGTRKEAVTGESIRDTYADMVLNRKGAVRYFEPAVLTPPTMEGAAEKLKLFADFAEGEKNIVENALVEEDQAERTLVIIKPDNWRHPSTKPGNIIDMLSRTGLRMVGCKIYQMSVEEGLEFYGPVQGVLREKLAPVIGKKAKEFLEKEFHIQLSDDADKGLTEIVGKAFADDQFHQIIEFMSGLRPEECAEGSLEDPGKVKCMILIYEGTDAIKKIRNVLGPTDPTKAPGGTVRRDFGSDIMVNTAHASDSPESVEREMKIVKINSNSMSNIIKDFLTRKGYI